VIGDTLGTLKVMNVPPDLHHKLKVKAATDGKSVRRFIIDILERELNAD
jgi:plasmid stability protein